MNNINRIFLDAVLNRLRYYKELGERTFEQLTDDDFHYQPNEESNSIAVIIQHMAGNMLSRWTNFLNEDGEKDWRNRDNEFEEQNLTARQLIELWQKGWSCCLDAIRSLKENDLLKTITIRNEELNVVDAINRQLAHYPYHVGQIIYVAKLIKNKDWKNLSIPKGGSAEFNQQMTATN